MISKWKKKFFYKVIKSSASRIYFKTMYAKNLFAFFKQLKKKKTYITNVKTLYTCRHEVYRKENLKSMYIHNKNV